jgi:hypothetical protein
MSNPPPRMPCAASEPGVSQRIGFPCFPMGQLLAPLNDPGVLQQSGHPSILAERVGAFPGTPLSVSKAHGVECGIEMVTFPLREGECSSGANTAFCRCDYHAKLRYVM